MPRFIVNGYATVNVCAYVNAETPEEALEKAGWGIYSGLEQMGEPTGFIPDDDKLEAVVYSDNSEEESDDANSSI